MDKISLIYNAENSDDEENVVAVLNDPEVASAFTERHQIEKKGPRELT